MIIGRNPGRNEDVEGLPFVGRGGKVLEGWLRGIGISRDDIWLTNTLKCYTRADRKPKPHELATCYELHLEKEIEFCRPQLILAFGSEAFATMTGRDRLSERHGIIYDRREEHGAYVIGCIHPGSALRSGLYMKSMLEDAVTAKPLAHLALRGELENLPAQYMAQ